jgi:hypothetical protein
VRFHHVIIGAVVLFLVGWVSLPFSTQREVTATVKDKARITKTDTSYYLIYTDQGVFENTDCWVCFKFASSTLYGRLEVGQTYDLKVYGWRVPIFSMYPNIWKIQH